MLPDLDHVARSEVFCVGWSDQGCMEGNERLPGRHHAHTWNDPLRSSDLRQRSTLSDTVWRLRCYLLDIQDISGDWLPLCFHILSPLKFLVAAVGVAVSVLHSVQNVLGSIPAAVIYNAVKTREVIIMTKSHEDASKANSRNVLYVLSGSSSDSWQCSS
jgi:hypothetical protein